MKPHVAAARAGIHVNTVRTWTLEDFKPFFSTHAQGGNGRVRDLDDNDLRVLVYIKELKRRGMNTEEVVATLTEAERKGFSNLPLPRNAEQVVPTAVIPRQAAEEVILAERQILNQHIQWLEGRVDELKDELADVRSSSEEKVETLTRKLIEAETELKLWKQGWRPPPENDNSNVR